MENKKIQRQYAQAAESSTFCLNGFCNRNFLNGEEGGGVSQSAECLLLLDTDNILANYEHVVHTFGPVFDGNSRILILGSMPSVKSREQQFYYAHPQNRFWKVLAAVFKEAVPVSVDEKREFLLKNHVALWDVIASCDIIGSSDSSIKNVKDNNMHVILDKTDIHTILVNGGKAYELFRKHCTQYLVGGNKPNVVKMPSTSPANAAWPLEKLIDIWRENILT